MALERLRAIHGPPVCGEGSLGFGNVLWAGVVDVVHGKNGMFTGNTETLAMGVDVDVVPDFVLHRLQPLNVRTGMGPPPRYFWPDGAFHGKAYRAEARDHLLTIGMLYGVAGYEWWAPMVRAGDVARNWWASAEACARIADPGHRPVAIEYPDGQGRFTGLDRVLARGESLRPGEVRHRVRYDDGLTVWSNLREEPWTVELAPAAGGEARAVTLAPYGRLVRAAGFETGLVLEAGAVHEYAEGPERLFVDGRGAPVTRGGFTTDGAVGILRDGPRRLRVHPIEYRLSAAEDGTPVIVTPNRLQLVPEGLGAEAGDVVHVTWYGLGDQELGTEVLTLQPEGLRLDWEVFRERGALSVGLRSLP